MSGRRPESEDTDPALELLRLAGPRRDAPAERRARVEQLVHAHWSRRMAARRQQRLQWVAVLGAAAAVVLVALVPRLAPRLEGGRGATAELVHGGVCYGIQARLVPLSTGAEVELGSMVETTESGRAALRLCGGASVRLDTDTRVALVEPNRLRLEKGAAYVDSAPGSGASRVTIETALGLVREEGTQFEVRVDRERLTVRVREGRAVLSSGGSEKAIPAGHEGSLAADGSLTLRSLAPTDEAWFWLLDCSPGFRLEGHSAVALLEWVARETGYRLRWGEPVLAQTAARMTLHGDLGAVRPDQVLDLVLPTCGLEHRLDGDDLVVSRVAR
jgi:ferric-dicitrate binding protein FerR (iron transport regulator)